MRLDVVVYVLVRCEILRVSRQSLAPLAGFGKRQGGQKIIGGCQDKARILAVVGGLFDLAIGPDGEHHAQREDEKYGC